jgi:hypothetical protein
MTTPKTIKKAASSQGSDAGTLSRRSFIAATAATGIAVGVGQCAMASPEVLAPKPENALPKVQPEMYTGTPAGLCSRS